MSGIKSKIASSFGSKTSGYLKHMCECFCSYHGNLNGKITSKKFSKKSPYNIYDNYKH